MNRMLSCLVLAAACGPTLAAQPSAQPAGSPPMAGTNHSYVSNRPPLRTGPLIKLPVASFRPSGWVGKALELQRDGLAGHLGEISVWLTRKDNAWLRTDGKGQYGWEEVPYWLRGYARMAYILGDQRMLDEAKVWIEGTLSSQRENGDFGPVQMRNGKRDLWAQMLMLQVLQSFHEFSNDPRVVPFMTRYFKWQATIPDEQFLKDYWENSRGGDNLASVYWLYNRTGDAFLLELATKIDRNTANWRQAENLPNWHVVNIAQCFRAPAIYSLQSGKKGDINASYRSFALVRERYGQVPGGMFGADENARPGHTDPHQAAETCGFVEQIYSNMIMTEITGDPSWAANTEDVAFNSMPAAFTPDYRALRYLTAPNQVVSDSKNHAPGVANEGPFFLMNPFSSRCCQHNHSSAWVNYAEHAWMATLDDGLAAVLYASGELNAKAGAAGGAVTLVTGTNYPFEDQVVISVKKAPPGGFPIYLCIPQWCQGASVAVNGKSIDERTTPGAFVGVRREWKAGDSISLSFPMHLKVRTWEKNKGSVSIDYGPLTFSLKIDEKYEAVASDKTAIGDSGWQPGADAKKWPSHEILPTSPWNYALVIDKADPSTSFEVVRKSWPASNQPFTNAEAPIVLHVKGKRLPGWTLDEHGLAGAVPQSPVESKEPLVELTLVPMGGARLRISSFPVTNR
ncbi:MAG: beta-L-arabinofuranosidase domain-containing protein [Planctomycetota bacterium]